MEWKQYQLDELFAIESPKKRFNANTITIYESRIEGSHPYVVRTSANNGQKGFIIQDEKYLSQSNTIAFGQDTATVFYQSEDYFTGDKIKVLSFIYPDHEFSEKIACFMICIIRKAFSNFKWGSSSFNEKILKKMLISLPTSNGIDPDFNYMRERIAELEAYLEVTGLKDYELTIREREVLKSKPQFKAFKITDLFVVKNTHSILKSEVSFINGTIPYVTAGETNNSIAGLISADHKIIEEGNSIMIGGKTTVITYQKQDYVSNDSHNLALYLKNSDYRNEMIQLYLVSALYKSLTVKYSWGNSISFKKIQKDTVKLPISKDGINPDYDYMETYIQAQEKLAIRNVVTLKSSIIKETESMVNAS